MTKKRKSTPTAGSSHGITKKQIKDVMEGNPIDLEEMFNATDMMLSKPDYETVSGIAAQ